MSNNKIAVTVRIGWRIIGNISQDQPNTIYRFRRIGISCMTTDQNLGTVNDQGFITTPHKQT